MTKTIKLLPLRGHNAKNFSDPTTATKLSGVACFSPVLLIIGQADDDDDVEKEDLDSHVPESRERLKLFRQTGQLVVLQKQVAQLDFFTFEIFSI